MIDNAIIDQSPSNPLNASSGSRTRGNGGGGGGGGVQTPDPLPFRNLEFKSLNPSPLFRFQKISGFAPDSVFIYALSHNV